MPLDNQGCTFTFKKLTRVPLRRRRRRRSNHQKEGRRNVCARNVAEEEEEGPPPSTETSLFPRVAAPGIEPTGRERTHWKLAQTNKHVVFVFKTRTFRERDCVASMPEMKEKESNPAQKSRRSSPKRGQRRTCVPTCDEVTTARWKRT